MAERKRHERKEIDFNIDRCLRPTVYCGNKDRIPYGTAYTRYTRRGTVYECLRKGIGVGIHKEKERGLDPNNLKNIPYIGEYFEEEFKRNGINTITDLVDRVRRIRNTANIDRLLRQILRKRDRRRRRGAGALDGRAFNSVILFLYYDGLMYVPECERL